ncbi:MAG: hypothetical protein AB2693_26575, partial [Candidatus Thiodiazotropha sp.]
RGSNTGDSYEQILCEIQEIINKFVATHQIILLGDMNASLDLRPNNSQDARLGEFCERNHLQCRQRGTPTFQHVNGKDEAEIDYILFGSSVNDLIRVVKVENHTDINTSDHIPVTGTLKLRVAAFCQKSVEIKVKPKWDKCDIPLYRSYVLNQLHPFNSPQTDNEFVMYLGHFASTLKSAVRVSIPGHKDSRKVNPVKDRVWNEEISNAIKECKTAWWQWRQAGAPENRDHPLSQQMKHCKRKLRKTQRQAEAKRRVENSERIMASSGNDKEFYRLIKLQRKTQDSQLPFLTVNNKILDSPEDICEGWATYFQDLATPSLSENFDNTVKESYAEDTEHILKICTQMNQNIPPATLEEVQHAILRLKSNKAADYMDLTSEHLKYGGHCVEAYLVNLVNFIFAAKRVPPVLKSGQITPIFKKGEKTNPANYRGITVTSIILKVVEHILNKRHNARLGESQSHLQKGFTAGSSS